MRPCGTTVDVQFHPDNIPSHSNVCTLNFDSRRYWDAGPPFTDVPFPGHTLPIQEWLVNSLTRAPQLVCVRSRAAEDLYKNSFKTKNNAGYTGLCLTTFTNGRNALVHCQKRGVAYPRLPYLRRGKTMLFDVRVPLVIRPEVTTNG